jgi:hypothetical protein
MRVTTRVENITACTLESVNPPLIDLPTANFASKTPFHQLDNHVSYTTMVNNDFTLSALSTDCLVIEACLKSRDD